MEGAETHFLQRIPVVMCLTFFVEHLVLGRASSTHHGSLCKDKQNINQYHCILGTKATFSGTNAKALATTSYFITIYWSERGPETTFNYIPSIYRAGMEKKESQMVFGQIKRVPATNTRCFRLLSFSWPARFLPLFITIILLKGELLFSSAQSLIRLAPKKEKALVIYNFVASFPRE